MSKRSKHEASSSGEQQQEEGGLQLPVGFPEDMRDRILLSLPQASILVRFRTAATAWRDLLSNDGFIRRFIFQNTDLWNDQRLVIQRRRNGRWEYSVHSHGSLALITGPAQLDELVPGNFQIRCGVKGVFCLSDGDGNGLSNILVWNPATSRNRLLPVSNYAHRMGDFNKVREGIGFCFHPEHNDYKVIRLIFGEHDEDIEEFCEVYSLSNGSWTSIIDGTAWEFDRTVHYSVPANDGRSFYWWGKELGRLQLISFYRRGERTKVRNHEFPGLLSSLSPQSISLVKGSTVVICSDENIDRHVPNELEAWVALDFERKTPNWIKLSTIEKGKLDTCVYPVGMWKDKRCFLQRYEDGQLVVVDLEDGKSVPVDLKIEGEWRSFKAFSYTPSEVQLV